MKTKASSIKIHITYDDVDGVEKTVSTAVARDTDRLPEVAQLLQLRREAVALIDHVASKIGLTHVSTEEPTVPDGKLPVAAPPTKVGRRRK